MTGSADLRAARARHPAATGRVGDRTRLERALADRLAAAGLAHPQVAAAAMAARGAAGLTVEAWARRLGVPESVVLAVEGGEVGPDALPATLGIDRVQGLT
jgi:ribosome-binding protein aMBF1 (putative translation factor)